MGREVKSKNSPTPYLRPRSDRQVYTVEQNRLLDQITMEIQEAWAKDLVTMRDCHKETKELLAEVKEHNEQMADKLIDLNKFLSQDDILPKLQKTFDRQELIFHFLEDIRQQLFKLDNNYVQTLIERIEKLEAAIAKTCEALKNKKRWWQFWR